MRSAAFLSLALLLLVDAFPVEYHQAGLAGFDKSFIRSNPHFIARDVSPYPSPASPSSTTLSPFTSTSASQETASSIAGSIPFTTLLTPSDPQSSVPTSSPTTSTMPSPSSSNVQSASSAPPQASPGASRKYVIAHHMVGNTFPYTVDNWVADITLAHAHGIDGFALNVGRDDWQPARVADAYQAANRSGTGFKLFLSFDMSSLPCSSPNDAATLRNYITTYATHPNQLIYDGRVFASTFAGESCTFGQASPAQGWSSQFTQHPQLTGRNAVYFVPSFFVDPNTFSTFNDAMDGALNWNSGWPITLTTASANSILSSVGVSLSSLTSSVGSIVQKTLSRFVTSTDSDTQYIKGLNTMSNKGRKRAYMATVSPWFFTHYSPQTFNKNFIYYADSHLYPARWETLISSRDKVDIVEIVTWNDYGESHYIGPIEGAQPNSQAWVDGLNHTGWLDMTSYYATAFKTGTHPAITKDKIYMWSRTHPRDANAPDPVGKPANFELTEDTLWAVAMTTAPATVTLSTGNGKTQAFNVPAGMNKLSIPISAGGTMHGTIARNGKTVVDFHPQGFTFNGSPQTYNYNAFVAVSN